MPNQPDKPNGPVGGFQPLSAVATDIWSAVVWGTEGTGKSLFVLKNFPPPIMVLNLDRPFTKAHLGMLSQERVDSIYVKNLRENLKDVDQLTATVIKGEIERALEQNLEWLRGGTFFLDGGTMYRDVLKLSDPTIGPKVASGSRFNPKDKSQINAYLGALISYIQDQGINFALTAHAAYSWVMKTTVNETTGATANQLAKTHNLYAKFDDIAFERANLSLLLFKRCECGRAIVNDDGTCLLQDNPQEDREKRIQGHQGRKHMARIVSNKFCTKTEGYVFEGLDAAMLQNLCDPKKAEAYL